MFLLGTLKVINEQFSRMVLYGIPFLQNANANHISCNVVLPFRKIKGKAPCRIPFHKLLENQAILNLGVENTAICESHEIMEKGNNFCPPFSQNKRKSPMTCTLYSIFVR